MFHLLLALFACFGLVTRVYSQPAYLAAAPTLPSANVDALYDSSGVYTPFSGINFNEAWCGNPESLYGILPTATTNVLFFPNNHCAGIGFEGNPQNVSGDVYLHVDLYTPNGSSFAVRLVDTTGHTADYVYTTAGGVIVPNTWLHLDMPLSSFTKTTPALNLGAIQQIGLINDDPGETQPADYYVDNMYFYFPLPSPLSVAITSPANGATVGNYFSINASASVYPGSVTNVNFYDGAALLGNATSSPFSYLTVNGLAAGAHTLKAIAYASGGTTATNSIAVTVTNVPIGAYEPFNYPLGAFASGTAATGTGLSGTWSVNGSAVIEPGLTYPNFPSADNSVQLAPAFQRASVTLSSPVSSGTIYFSWLTSQNGDNGGNANGIYLQGTGATSLYAGLTAGYSGSAGSFGLASVNTAAAGGQGFTSFFAQANGALIYGSPNLIVVGITFNTSGANDTVKVWINPTAGTNTPTGNATDPNPDLTWTTYDVGTITGIGINMQGGGNPVQFDEINVGTNYSSVVGGAPPMPTIPTTITITTNPIVQVSWTAKATNSYQPQSSPDNSTWTSLGSPLFGNAVNSYIDAPPAPFYQVLEYVAGGPGPNVIGNGSFELPAANSIGATNWSPYSPNGPYISVWVTNQYGSLTPPDGTNMLYMEGATASSSPTAPNIGITSDFSAPVVGGVPYVLHFSAANPVQIGGANPQYHIFWADSGNNPQGDVFGSFASASSSSFTTFNLTNTAPAGATKMELQFFQALGAGPSWDWVTLIDNVKFYAVVLPGSTNILTPTLHFGDTFTATVNTNGVNAGDASGTITFQTNGVTSSIASASGGVGTSGNVVLNPPYTVTAIYSGDNNYIGSTGTYSVSGGTASNPTNITYMVTGKQITLSWPADHLGWILQTQTNSLSRGITSNWTDLAATGSTNVWQVTNNLSIPVQFFRLRAP